MDRVDEALHEIEHSTWLTATAEPNRQDGASRRQFAGQLIRSRLNGVPRAPLNAALSLGFTINQFDDNKELRRGIRAIMLAKFILKGVPTEQAPFLKQQWGKASKSEINRGFLACLPSVLDQNTPGRQNWDPANFTDPLTFPDWNPSGQNQRPNLTYRFIVSCLPTDSRADPTLADPNSTIQGWGAISTSLVDQGNSFMYGHYGFVLRVPANNVLVTHSCDQDIKQHLGTGLTRAPAAEKGMDPLVLQGLLSNHVSDLFAKQGGLKSPDDCLRNRDSKWNEVVVMGRHPSTGSTISVSALFFRVSFNHRYYVGETSMSSPITPAIEQKVQSAAAKLGVPVIYIPDGSGKKFEQQVKHYAPSPAKKTAT